MTPAARIAGRGGHVERAVAGLDLIEHRDRRCRRRPPSVPPRSAPGAGPDRPSRWRRSRSARTAGSASRSRRRCSCRCRPACWRATSSAAWICCTCVAIALRSGADIGGVVRLEREVAQALQLHSAPASARCPRCSGSPCALLPLAVYCWLCASTWL